MADGWSWHVRPFYYIKNGIFWVKPGYKWRQSNRMGMFRWLKVHISVGSISFYQYLLILMHVWLGRSTKVVKMSDFKLFFTKMRFSQNRVFGTSSNLHVMNLKNRATLSLTFFCVCLIRLFTRSPTRIRYET